MLASFLNLSVRILFSIMLEFLLVLPSFLGFLGNGFLALFLLSCSLPSPLEDLALPYPALGPDEFLADLPTPWLVISSKSASSSSSSFSTSASSASSAPAVSSAASSPSYL